MDVGVGLLLVIFILFLLTIGVFFVYAGLFTRIEVKAGPPPFGQLVVAYNFARGPYHKAGHLFTKAHSLLPELPTVGIYYDEPNSTSPEKLRYIVGLVVSKNGEEPAEDMKSLLEKEEYQFITLPKVDHAVMTTFPFNCTLSVLIAVARVYPKLAEYIRSHGLCAYPMIEYYSDGEILFLAPLSHQDAFFVPEAHEEESAVLPGEEEEEPHTLLPVHTGLPDDAWICETCRESVIK